MKSKSIGKVGKLLVALLVISALLPIAYAIDDTENFGISLPIDYTATSNQPPTVSITSPSEGATVNGTVSITGTASDSDGTVQSVEVKIGSDAWATASGTTSWTFTWDTTGYSDGSYTILARSYDGTNYSTEAQVNVTINNTDPSTNHAPAITLNSPSNGIRYREFWHLSPNRLYSSKPRSDHNSQLPGQRLDRSGCERIHKCNRFGS